MEHDHALLTGLREVVQPLDDTLDPGEALHACIPRDAQVVLLGEATHGTHEFYAMRALLTERLILERGFTAVAVESDWPDAARVNRYVRGAEQDRDAVHALQGYDRFPRWMWRNAEIVAFAERLRDLNAHRSAKVGFYGLDLYSMHASIDEVLRFLAVHAPDALPAARARYACLDNPERSAQAYGSATWQGLIDSCEDEVVEALAELERRREAAIVRGPATERAWFDALQNAQVVLKSEQYYRTMYRGGASSWNLRDTHMADTLDGLLAHLSHQGLPPKVVVWAHNSHIGDARATEAGDGGELNLGQLMRERHRSGVVNIGFTTYEGTVTAADDWDGPPRRHRVRPALSGSCEELFHHLGIPSFWLDLKQLGEAGRGLAERRLERMIGVVYRPRSERWSHYVMASLPAQFDVVVHLDETHALAPLDREGGWTTDEPPETYPSAL